MNAFSVTSNWNMLAQLIAKAVIIFLCFPVHECAHAWIASKLGDSTGERQGRITLNPFVHLDPWGTLMLIALGAGFAKPVPVNARNLRNPRKDLAIVSLAGPMSNLIMAVSFLFAGHVIYHAIGNMAVNGSLLGFVAYCLSSVAYVNFNLLVFNLIPIPPLDGYHVFLAVVPDRFYYKFARFETYSVYAMLGLFLAFSLLRISPVVVVAQNLYDSVDSLYNVILQF